MIDPVKNFNTLTSSTRLVLTFKPVESLYILDKSKMDKTPNVKMIDSFNSLSTHVNHLRSFVVFVSNPPLFLTSRF